MGMDDSFSVEQHLDDHHKQLLALLNTTRKLLYSKAADKEVQELLRDLLNYVTINFAAEEDWMVGIGFPQKHRHIEQHLAYKSSDIALNQQLASAGGNVVILGIFFFLKEWLVNHILSADRKIAVNPEGSFW